MALDVTQAFITEAATAPIAVFSCLSEPVELFEVSHQAQLVWWQDLLGWNRRNAEQEPKQQKKRMSHAVRVKKNNETRLIHIDASLW